MLARTFGFVIFLFLVSACQPAGNDRTTAGGPQATKDIPSSRFTSPDFAGWEVLCEEECFVKFQGGQFYVYVLGTQDYLIEIRRHDGKPFSETSQAYLDWSWTYANLPRSNFVNENGALVMRGQDAFEAATKLNIRYAYLRVGQPGHQSSDLMRSGYTNAGVGEGRYTGTGLGNALAVVHEKNGVPFKASSFSGGKVSIGGKRVEPKYPNRTPPTAAASAGSSAGSSQSSSRSGCSDAEIRREINRLEGLANQRAGGSGGGTAVLAAEWLADESLKVYRRCYRPSLDDEIAYVQSVKKWAVEQKRNLGLN